MHRELVQKNVTRKTPRRLRVRRQSDDAHAARQHDFELSKAHVFEESVVVIVGGDFQRLAVLPGLGHQLPTLTLAGRKKNLRSPAHQPTKNPTKRLGEALSRLPRPAVPPKPRVGLHVLTLVGKQFDNGSDPRRFGCRFGWRDLHHNATTRRADAGGSCKKRARTWKRIAGTTPSRERPRCTVYLGGVDPETPTAELRSRAYPRHID